MICPNCKQDIDLPVKMCLECDNICPKCGVVIDLGTISTTPRQEYKPCKKPSDRPLWHYWEGLTHGQAINKVLIDNFSFPNITDIPVQENEVFTENEQIEKTGCYVEMDK